MCCGCAVGRSGTKNTKVDYGTSDLFTQEDREQAVACIKQSIETNKNITALYRLTYAGDARSQYEQQYYRNDYDKYEEVIVFTGDYHTALTAGGAYDTNSTYDDWSWILGRHPGGEWVIITQGYA